MSSRSLSLAAIAAASVVFAFAACSGTGPSGSAQVTISLNPGAIDNVGGATVITVEGTTESGAAGAGTVKVSTAAGSLKDGTSVTLDSKGQGTAMFTCAVATDPKCVGSVKITAEWTRSGASTITSVRNISVGAGGTGGGSGGSGGSGGAAGGGSGGGSGGGAAGGGAGGGSGGGAGGGSADAGTTNLVAITLQKLSLVVATGDNTEITAKVTVAATGAPVANTAVTFATNRGSFAMTAGTSTAMAMTDAMGNAKVTLYVAGAMAGTANVTASALDGTTSIGIPFINVASIVPAPDATVKPILGTQSGGRETTTPVLFKVVDANNMAAPGVAVTFTIGPGSPAGASLTPTGTSNGMGIATTTLQSGDTVGAVSVVATITATIGPTPITATATIQITGGKPSFRGLVVDCQRKNMGALTKPGSVDGIPTRPLMNNCTTNLADRFGNVVGLVTQVSWFAERGTISPSNSMNGVATSIYDTTANAPPNDTTPLTNPAEPTNGTKNPRDMIISIIGVVAGEEEFTDTNGNGKWDPGEWFLDLPEPFVDDNDNQKWDQGEAKIDTQRLNCTTGMVEAPNGTWDGPNGCWDNNTQIFGTTHVTWSGVLSRPIEFLTAQPPWFVPSGSVLAVDFNWSDDWFNPMSPDAPAMSVTFLGTKGSAAVVAPGLVADGLGHGIAYEKVEATESAAGSGVFTFNGICDTSKPGPTNPLTRCLSRYRFASFGRGSRGQLQITSPPAVVPPTPPATVSITINAQNSFFTPASQGYSATIQ